MWGWDPNFRMIRPRGDDSWYPVYKRPWYSIDICLLNSVKIWLLSAIFFTLTTVHWYLANISPADISWYTAEICAIFHWTPVNFLLISVYYTSDIRLISWYRENTFPARYYPSTEYKFTIEVNIPKGDRITDDWIQSTKIKINKT